MIEGGGSCATEYSSFTPPQRCSRWATGRSTRFILPACILSSFESARVVVALLGASPDISHWRGLREFGRSAVSRRFRGRRDRRGLWRLVRMAMFPALWKVRRKAAAYAAALVNRAWARAHSACQG